MRRHDQIKSFVGEYCKQKEEKFLKSLPMLFIGLHILCYDVTVSSHDSNGIIMYHFKTTPPWQSHGPNLPENDETSKTNPVEPKHIIFKGKCQVPQKRLPGWPNEEMNQGLKI